MKSPLQLAAADPDLPQVFGRYLLLSRLSRGGMGEIFLAKHGLAGFEKLVVIKKVLPHLVEDEEFIKRFIDEAQVAIKLQHQNIAQVFEVGCIGQEYFLSLEYVEGRDLRRLARVLRDRRERLPVEHALFITREICSGLAYAHRRTDASGASLNLVHCDISPPNIVVSFEGEAKVIDFGIAKSAMRRTATDPKLGFGKFGYMAPEQLVRGGVVDYRTDIYATGVVLFELLTGTRMYEPGETPDYRALARMVARGEYPLPSHIDPSLRPFDELVARALQPDPSTRYQRAAEFRDAAQTALVAINPAAAHEHLGAYMRYLFADEVTAQRHAIERALATDIRPYQAELTHQSEGTVTFAVANLPLRAPAATGRLERPTTLRTRLPRGRVAVIATAALAALLVGGAAIAWVTGGEASGPRRGDAVASLTALPPPVAAPAPPPTVEAIVSALPPDAAPPPDAAQPKPAARAPEPARPARASRARRARRARVDRPSSPPAAPAEASADRERIDAKFKALSREYRKFKGRYGGLLESEWFELLNSTQYGSESPDRLEALDNKIDGFRAKMRAARGNR